MEPNSETDKDGRETREALRKQLGRLRDLVEGGTLGHFMGALLGGARKDKAGSSWKVEIQRRVLDAVRRTDTVSRFVEELLEQPQDSWQMFLEQEGGEHRGQLLSTILGNVAMRRQSPQEAFDLALLARPAAGEEALDAEIELLLEAVEATALHRLGESARGRTLIESVRKDIGEITLTLHPEIVADVWWLCGMFHQLTGHTASALSDLETAIRWAEDILDNFRVAVFESDKALVLELSKRFDEACAADERAWEALGETTRHRDRRLVERVVVQRASHLVEVGRFVEAEQVLDDCEDVFRERRPSTAVRLRGRIAWGLGHREDALLFLETAQEMAAIDEDWPELGLACVEQVGFFDELEQWARRGEAVGSLRESMSSWPSVPQEIETALSQLDREDSEGAWGPSVVGCMRRTFRQWQTRQISGRTVAVM